MDIREEIKQKYNIDISKENILKLYKIDKADISRKDILLHIDETRARWNQSINGSNEKNAARDKKRLEKATKYEQILLKDEYRKELFQYYNSSRGNEDYRKSLKKAEVYFSNLSMGKSISQADLDFYFDFYKKDKKYKKNIVKVIKEKHHIADAKKESEETDKSGRFQKDTILGIQN